MEEEAVYVGLSPASQHRIACGKCKGHHNSADGVRECFRGNEVGSCPDQYYLPDSQRTEDGLRLVEECGMDSWATRRGWTCAYGHEHVDTETRWNEGWDYAADEGEAYLLRMAGRDAVSMRGDSI